MNLMDRRNFITLGLAAAFGRRSIGTDSLQGFPFQEAPNVVQSIGDIYLSSADFPQIDWNSRFQFIQASLQLG